MADTTSVIKSTSLQGLEGFNSSAATFANDVDEAFWIHIYISIFLFAIVVGTMLYFAWKYRASNVKDEDIVNIKHHTGLEITWTVVPTILVMVMFYYGYTSMKALRTMPDVSSDTVQVNVLGKKWNWSYTYAANDAGHVHATSQLYVPVNTDVILSMTSPIGDVIHSYFVPAFRMKEDLVPGRTTKQWFNSAVPGKYVVECAEYCGTSHSDMYSEIHVMAKADYDAWYASTNPTPYASELTGEQIATNKGCTGCHTNDGTMLVGPSFKGVSDRRDDAFIKDIIVNGSKNYMMPPQDLTEKELEKVMTYLKGVK